MYGERGKSVYCNYGECTVSVVSQFIVIMVSVWRSGKSVYCKYGECTVSVVRQFIVIMVSVR